MNDSTFSSLAYVRSLASELPTKEAKALVKLLDQLEDKLSSAGDQRPYQDWVSRYYQHRQEIGSPLPRWTGADGKAIKDMRSYLLRLTGGNPDMAYGAFDYVLNHWRELSPFLQSMIRPAQMNKYLDEIVMKLNPHGAGKTKQQAARAATEAYRRNLAQRLSGGAGTPPKTD